jgi:hypothetical protein
MDLLNVETPFSGSELSLAMTITKKHYLFEQPDNRRLF